MPMMDATLLVKVLFVLVIVQLARSNAVKLQGLALQPQNLVTVRVTLHCLHLNSRSGACALGARVPVAS